jgi:hypothetical protein
VTLKCQVIGAEHFEKIEAVALISKVVELVQVEGEGHERIEAMIREGHHRLHSALVIE